MKLEDFSSVTFHGIELLNILAIAAKLLYFFGPYVLFGVSDLEKPRILI